jgi:hypothetical protein
VLHAEGVITATDIIVDAPSDGLRLRRDETAFGRRVAGMAY